jgi:hypothetical protein
MGREQNAMTGPNPGQGDDTPPTLGGQPPESRYETGWDEQAAEPYYDDYQTRFAARRRPSRKVLIAIAAAVVVVAGAATALFAFGGFPGRSGGRPAAASQRPSSHAAPAPSLSVPPRVTVTTPAGQSNANHAAAYDVGTCFDEVRGAAAGKVELNPVPCGGTEAVFVINDVVASAPDCDTGQGAADYKNHGYEVPDETAQVAYCASLVVPAHECFVLSGTLPIARAACGAAPGVVQVMSIESAPSAATACTDKSNPDVWFYQGVNTGQYACVSRPGAPVSTTTTTTATTG